MRKKRKYPSLEEALSKQGPTQSCVECSKEARLNAKPYALPFLEVLDFPVYVCPTCGSEFHTISVSIAIEELQEKHSLIGKFKMDQLLQIAKGGISS